MGIPRYTEQAPLHLRHLTEKEIPALSARAASGIFLAEAQQNRPVQESNAAVHHRFNAALCRGSLET
jgi:hypothetical protein